MVIIGLKAISVQSIEIVLTGTELGNKRLNGLMGGSWLAGWQDGPLLL